MDTLALFVLAIILPYAVVCLTIAAVQGGQALMKWLQDRRQARLARFEAELDRKQAELRAATLRLADALGQEAHEARKALIRESFLARGELPKN